MGGIVRWGILSTALIAREHMIPALHGAEHCEPHAIASRTRELAAIVAEDHGIPVTYDSYEDLLADPDVDAVYIPLPNHLHARWIARAVDAGKHVLCEKPLTLTARQAERVAAHAERQGLLVMEAFMFRFHPAWQMGRKLIAAGAVGTVTDVDIRFGFRARRDDDYRMVPHYGGGALYDVGCYAINVSRMLFGDEPARVVATARLHPTRGIDMTMSAILDYGVARTTFTCSMEQEPDHRFHAYGTEGWMSIEDPFNCPPERTTRILIATGGDDVPDDSTIRVIDVPAGNQYGLQATAFARAILEERPAPVPTTDSVANMRLIERVFSAAGVAMRRGGGIAVST